MRTILVVLSLAVMAGNPGCTAFAVGGAASGTSTGGAQHRATGRDDAAITQVIRNNLVRNRYIDASAIEVSTERGVVTLNGRVDNSVARDQAAGLAGDTPGVKSVVNNIAVE